MTKLPTSRFLWALFVLGLLLAVGCGSEATGPPQSPLGAAPMDQSQIISLGDIDPDEPAKKIARFQPLADYLAANLSDFGIRKGEVVIAQDIPRMGTYLKDGTVDIFFDSPFPTLAAQELSGSEIVLRRWKEGVVEYWSRFIARKDGGISRVGDFKGSVIAFEEPRSTSGFLLPAGTLIQRGFILTEVSGPGAQIAAGEIGYYFSRDEENTVELVLRAGVAGGGISKDDYQELPPAIMDQLVVFDRTITVPRQLVSVRAGLDPELVSRIQTLLIELDQTEDGLALLEGLKRTKKFDLLPPESKDSLQELRELMTLVSEG